MIHLVTFFAIVLMPFGANAFTINTGFSEGCHEFLTVRPALALSRQSPVDQDGELPIPESETYRALTRLAHENIEFENETEEFLVVSIVAGVREPDTHGHSVADIASLRRAHTHPTGQYEHFLRSVNDDGPSGDLTVLRRSRALILSNFRKALELYQAPAPHQIVNADVYFEFYGVTKVPLWGPGYHAGLAVHVLQDSFSHALRTPDFKRVIHVMNFIEAIGSDFAAHRDGLAHSNAMDRCFDEAADVARASEEATEDLLHAFAIGLRDGSEEPLVAVLDEWLTYEPGCDSSNAYCDAPHLELARTDPTRAFLKEFASCSSSPSPDGWPWWPLALLAVGWIFRVARTRQ